MRSSSSSSSSSATVPASSSSSSTVPPAYQPAAYPAPATYPAPSYDPYALPPDPYALPPDPYAASYAYPYQYPGYAYPYPYPQAYHDPQAYPPYAPPVELVNPSTYQERPAEKTHGMWQNFHVHKQNCFHGVCVVVRRAGGGLAALSKPIQDLFDQIFAMGHVSKEDVPDSIYDSLQGFEGACVMS